MLQNPPKRSSGASMSLPSIAVDQITQLVPPTIGCLLGLTVIADEVSERWITPGRDREVTRRWLTRLIERNNEGQIARFCIHREAQCVGVVGFSSPDPVRMSWWVGPAWRGRVWRRPPAGLYWLGSPRLGW